MLYSYNAKKTKNSAQQILTGTIKEVQDKAVLVTVPVGFNNIKEFSINKASLAAFGDLKVGMPISAIGLDNEDGTFEVDEKAQEQLASTAVQFLQFDRYKQNDEKTKETSIFLNFPISKVAQVMLDEEKKCVTVPANVGDKTVWLRFYQNKFSHFENYEAEGKSRLGIKSYAQMLQKKINELGENDVLLVPYVGRFEDYNKETKESTPCAPQEKDGKLVYSVLGQGENALGTMLNTSVAVAKSFVPMSKNGQQKKATNEVPVAEEPAPEMEISEDEEMELLQAMGQ